VPLPPPPHPEKTAVAHTSHEHAQIRTMIFFVDNCCRKKSPDQLNTIYCSSKSVEENGIAPLGRRDAGLLLGSSCR
jgi:hypothetical protein